MSPTNEHIVKGLERVLASSLFKKADRQSRFLRHVVERHLAGDDDSLREMPIGLEVYERQASYDPKTDPIVRVEAARLRSRLREYYESEGASDPLRIDIPKGSYVPAFEWRGEEPEVVKEPPPPPESANKNRWLIAAAALAGIAVLAAVIAFRPRPAAKVVPIDSIALLPFSDLSEKKDLSYLTEGLTEQIEDELTRIRDLRVVGSTTARKAAENPDLRAAARQMGVDALLLGSLRAEANQVRVTVRLYEGATGTAIWSGSFEGERMGLFQLEDQIARAVAGKLAIQLAGRREGIDARTAPQRAQAYEYTREARALAEKDSTGPFDEVLRLYQQAATADPSYAPAHAGIATTLIVGGNPDKARAFREVKRALELDPGLPRAHMVLILYYRDVEMDWAKARATCNDSLQKLPNAATILQECSSIESILLNRAKAVELIRRAVALDPLSPVTHGGLMFLLYQAGQFAEALSEADIALQLGSKSNFVHRHRALILGAMGRPLDGLKEIDDAQAQLGGRAGEWAMVRGYLLGRAKRRGEAEKLLRAYRATEEVPPLHIAVIYLGMEERAKSLDYFEKALAETPADMAHAVSQYYMRVLDGEPRFESIKRKLRL